GPRPAVNDFALSRDRSYEADLQIPGPPFPSYGCRRRGCKEHPDLARTRVGACESCHDIFRGKGQDQKSPAAVRHMGRRRAGQHKIQFLDQLNGDSMASRRAFLLNTAALTIAAAADVKVSGVAQESDRLNRQP